MIPKKRKDQFLNLNEASSEIGKMSSGFLVSENIFSPIYMGPKIFGTKCISIESIKVCQHTFVLVNTRMNDSPNLIIRTFYQLLNVLKMYPYVNSLATPRRIAREPTVGRDP